MAAVGSIVGAIGCNNYARSNKNIQLQRLPTSKNKLGRNW
jgi:hypothetical protein